MNFFSKKLQHRNLVPGLRALKCAVCMHLYMIVYTCIQLFCHFSHSSNESHSKCFSFTSALSSSRESYLVTSTYPQTQGNKKDVQKRDARQVQSITFTQYR